MQLRRAGLVYRLLAVGVGVVDDGTFRWRSTGRIAPAGSSRIPGSRHSGVMAVY